MTQESLLDALAEDLKRLFAHYRTKNSTGAELPVRVYTQDVPFREGEADDPEREDPPEPYILARLSGGELPEAGSLQTVQAVLVVCVYDPDPNRQGFRDALHIVNAVLCRYGANGVVGGRWVLQYPIKWAAQEEDAHPYYFAAMALTFEGPAIYKEVPEA